MRRVLSKIGQAALMAALLGVGAPAFAEAQAAPPAAPPDSLEQATALVRSHSYRQAEALLRRLLAGDPANRRAQELLAFALESSGDLAGEYTVRSALAREFPDDRRVQVDLGRVLERSGEETAALHSYERARDLDPTRVDPDLERAIERLRGRNAVEVATPVATISDPDARASRVQAGVALPLGSHARASLLGAHWNASGTAQPGATQADVLALTVVQRYQSGASWAIGPHAEVFSPSGAAPRDAGVGGAFAVRAPLGRLLEIDARGVAEAPWDEAAVTMLHGGRTSGLEGQLYAHGFSRRLLLQAGVRRRELSVLAEDDAAVRRPSAWQKLYIAGADLVLWSSPGSSLRGEMLDEGLTAPVAASSAVTLAYRHYDLTTDAGFAFNRILALVPRSRVGELSGTAAVASPGGDYYLALDGGLGHDAARDANQWRGGGALIWAPLPAARFTLRYHEASELAAGLMGRSRRGELSVHVDL